MSRALALVSGSSGVRGVASGYSGGRSSGREWTRVPGSDMARRGPYAPTRASATRSPQAGLREREACPAQRGRMCLLCPDFAPSLRHDGSRATLRETEGRPANRVICCMRQPSLASLATRLAMLRGPARVGAVGAGTGGGALLPQTAASGTVSQRDPDPPMNYPGWMALDRARREARSTNLSAPMRALARQGSARRR